jgi:putative ABC transport system substrate-binding protein
MLSVRRGRSSPLTRKRRLPHHPGMDRRRFLLTSLAGVVAAPLAAEALQAGKVSRIGYLSPLSPAADATRREGFQQGLEGLGYREGQNVAIEYRWAEGNLDRQDDLAAELVRLKIDVLLAAGGNHTVRAAKKATASIPIVMTMADDSVASGLVTSLARPGGNVTGLNTQTADLAAKRLELLREVLPSIHRVAVLWNPAVPERALDLKNTQLAARTLHVEIQSVQVRRPEDLDDKFTAMVKGRAEALVILADPVTNTHRAKIIELATKKRLPTMFTQRQPVGAGGLVSYGTNYEALFRRAAIYVDKILRGAKPAELPVQLPIQFELVINLKTAKALGLTIPPSLLARADQVIE